jgi:geranylgeranylglycerol-phosphate geranylgeranyltransferase
MNSTTQFLLTIIKKGIQVIVMPNVRGYLALIRPLNCVVMSFAILVGAVLTGLNNLSWLHMLYGGLTSFTLTAAAMAVNDYYDYEIDRINEPKRPIPSGAVSLNASLVVTAVLTAVGFIFAFLVSTYCLIFAVAAWAIMVAYSTFGKRSGLPGNFLVSACVAAPFLYGSLVAANTIPLNVFLFASMAFLSNTGREISKGIVDVEGDKSYNIHTLAVAFGGKRAALVAAVFFVLAVCLSPIPLIYNLVSIWFVPFVLVTDLGLVWCSISLLKDPSRDNARKIKKLVLFLFIFGLLSFIAGMFR